MQSNRIPHRDMIPVMSGHGGVTGQLVSRQAWQHEARAALVAARSVQDAALAPETESSGGVSAGPSRLSAALGGVLIRIGTRLQGSATGVHPAGKPV
jgi:hypothetical protein